LFCTAPLGRRPAGEDLICINTRSADPADGAMMIRQHLSPIRHCPVCGIAMQASKSRENLAAFDTFRCLNCDTAIHESAAQTSHVARDEAGEH
jgi:hypothetical protein